MGLDKQRGGSNTPKFVPQSHYIVCSLLFILHVNCYFKLMFV